MNFINYIVIVLVITIETKANQVIKKIDFKRSNFSVYVMKQQDDSRYLARVWYNGNKVVQTFYLGKSIENQNISVGAISNGVELFTNSYSASIQFKITVDLEDFSVLQISRTLKKNDMVTDCFNLESENMNWYGGPQHDIQLYPVQKMKFKDHAFIPKDGDVIMERYWLNSRGLSVYIFDATPLFVDQNSIEADHICFTAKNASPYRIQKETFQFRYNLAFSKDVKTTQMNNMHHFSSDKPHALPNERMVKYPSWNTWVRYGRNVNEQTIKDFLSEISMNNFNYSLLVIDDFWEEKCYGSTTIDKVKFPNMKMLITELKKKYNGLAFSLWIHPYINKDCLPYYSLAMENNYLVKSKPESYDTSWWNSGTNNAAKIDFSNANATKWFRNKLLRLKQESGIDSFKFVGCEPKFLTLNPASGITKRPPIQVMEDYKILLQFGDMMEFSSSRRMQHLNAFSRMHGFNSRWTIDNGLKALIPRLLQMNFASYSFVLPDYVGGNRYGDDITKELFIRWLQATVFMPCIQFSVTPWDFDEQTVDIAKKFTKLHLDYSEFILQRFKSGITKRDPVNLPIWWIDPEDKIAQQVSDQFLLGETILSAPIVDKGKMRRDIYLPEGYWKDGNNGSIYEGKRWLKNYPAPIDVLPYFIRQYNTSAAYVHLETSDLYLTIKQMYFKRSNVSFTIQVEKPEKIHLFMFNGYKFIQRIVLNPNLGKGVWTINEIPNGFELLQAHSLVRILVTIDVDIEDFSVVNIERKMSINDVATDCVHLKSATTNWYGGTNQYGSSYPVQKNNFKSFAYTQITLYFNGRYWLNSRGFFLFINYDVPLFVDQNMMYKDYLCYTAKNGEPYSIVDKTFNFNYKIGLSSNAKRTQMNVAQRYLRTYYGEPDERAIRKPSYSPSYVYTSPDTEATYREYMHNILKHGLEIGTLSFEVHFTSCFGSNKVDTKRFPNMKQLVADIRSKLKDVKVLFKIIPYIEIPCLPNYDIARKNNYFLPLINGTTLFGDQLNDHSKNSYQLNFANPNATKWFKSDLVRFKQETGIDVFSIDSQGTFLNFAENPNTYRNKALPPDLSAANYFKLEEVFDEKIRFRVGWGTQNLNEVVKNNYNHKDLYENHDWSSIKLMVPKIIQANLQGFHMFKRCYFSMQFNATYKEIFIRLSQATIFLPKIRYCTGPWQFDQETVDIRKKLDRLHLDYSDLMIERYKLANAKQEPMHLPIWWLDPEDKIAQTVSDEYLLGETVLIAPVVEEGKRQRDIYLPVGKWKDGNYGKVYEGKSWVRGYKAPLNVLPYFIKHY